MNKRDDVLRYLAEAVARDEKVIHQRLYDLHQKYSNDIFRAEASLDQQLEKLR